MHFESEPARTLLGFEPEETWPQGADGVLADFGASLLDVQRVGKRVE